MLSKSQISLITSLQHKKFRKQHGLFVVEGVKSILEFIDSPHDIETVFTTSAAAAKLGKIPQNIKCVEVSDSDFNKISLLKHPQGALALVRLPAAPAMDLADLRGKHTLVLDEVQDPGNLGTIIRTAEWFGFRQIFCSQGTVDAYNPKVVQATMGSLSRMHMVYTDIARMVQAGSVPSYGALLNGKSIYSTDFGTEGLIILGNEGNGISEELIGKIDYAVTIPSFGYAESLNVAIAATVFCSEIVRTKQKLT